MPPADMVLGLACLVWTQLGRVELELFGPDFTAEAQFSGPEGYGKRPAGGVDSRRSFGIRPGAV